MKKYILILFIFLGFKFEAYCDGKIDNDTFLGCITTGFQSDVSNDLSSLTYAFDNNLTLLYINTGLNYNSNNVTTFYAGVGIGSVIQLQYGKPINIKENLLRVRFDIPLMLFIDDDSSIFNYTYIGIYYINSDKKNQL